LQQAATNQRHAGVGTDSSGAGSSRPAQFIVINVMIGIGKAHPRDVR
jgi:hypothetical protein